MPCLYDYGMSGPRFEVCSGCGEEVDTDRHAAIPCAECERVYCETCAPPDDLNRTVCEDVRCLRKYAKRIEAKLPESGPIYVEVATG